MSNFDTVVLDGEMGLFTTIREGDLPYYTGATEVTPSDQTQTLPTADTIVTSNITINPIPDIDLEEVQVTYTPDEEGQTDTITPSTGYVGISEVEVTVEPIDTDYVGSGIARNDSDDLTASGATITAPAGYYENDATKTVASGSAVTPATEIIANPTISVGNDGSITATVSATQSVTPTVEAGYVSSGTAGTITVSGSGSSQLPTQAGTTITPTTSQQTAVAAGKFTTGAVVVDKIPSQYIIPTGTKSISANGTGIDVAQYAAVDVAVPGDTPTLETKSVSYTPTESQQTATVTASTGYDGLEEVDITVGAISSSYVGSAIDRRDSTDLSASGATVTAPAGYYESAATKSVPSGTAGTPSATKGAVSNHSVSVTPSVTNTAGYISGGTISGTAVTVDVTELESGTKSITENGTGISVSGYSAVDVSVSGGGTDTIAQRIENEITNYTYTGTATLPGGLFQLCTSLVSVSFPNVTVIGGPSGTSNDTGRQFRACTNLQTVNFPELTTISGTSTFDGCKALSTVLFPKLTTVNASYLFNDCGTGKTYVLPSIATLTQDTFRSTSCVVDLGSSLASLPARAFYSATYSTVIFRNAAQVVVATADNSIQGINQNTTIYIPKALYDHLGDGTALDYRSATNWAAKTTTTFACIEGSQYETAYADGTPIPTT